MSAGIVLSNFNFRVSSMAPTGFFESSFEEPEVPLAGVFKPPARLTEGRAIDIARDATKKSFFDIRTSKTPAPFPVPGHSISQESQGNLRVRWH